MKFHCLGLAPTSSCYLLEYYNTRILFDCGIEFNSILQFLPNSSILNLHSKHNQQQQQHQNQQSNDQFDSTLKNSSCFKSINNIVFIDSNVKYHTPTFELVDFSTIDVILISNYMNIFSLPYITEYTTFNGKIYATEPTIQIGKLLILELIQYDKNSNQKTNLNQYWQSSHLLDQIGAQQANSIFKHAKSFKELYTRIDCDKSFEKIQSIRFNEYLKFYNFTIQSSSSGYCLGSCNWILESLNEKIVYLSDSSVYDNRYPEPFDLQAIQNPTILITAAKLNNQQLQIQQQQQQSTTPSNYIESLNEFFNTVGDVINNAHGSILIPSYSCGTVLDLFEPLHEYLTKLGMSQVPIYYISSIGKAILSYADIYSEWLNKPKKERSLIPDSPFLHQDMIRNQNLIPLQHINSQMTFKEPCIIFAGHPSCRMGDVEHLINQFVENPKNTIVMVEPDYQLSKTILPWQPIHCKIQYIPIDPRINHSDFNILVNQLSPQNLLIPFQYQNHIKNQHLNGSYGLTTLIYPTDILKIKIEQKQSIKYTSGHIESSLSQSIQPKQIYINGASPVLVAQLNQGSISLKDNQYLLSNESNINPVSPNNSNINTPKKQSQSQTNTNINYLWGKLSIDLFIKDLVKRGYNNIQSNTDQFNTIIIHILHKMVGTNQPTTTKVNINSISAVVETNCETTRKVIYESLSSILNKF